MLLFFGLVGLGFHFWVLGIRFSVLDSYKAKDFGQERLAQIHQKRIISGTGCSKSIRESTLTLMADEMNGGKDIQVFWLGDVVFEGPG